MHMKFETEIPKQTWVTLLKACQAAILKLTVLKINSLLPMYISIVPLKFGVDIQSQTKVRVRKQKKNPIWLPGGRFEINVDENQ